MANTKTHPVNAGSLQLEHDITPRDLHHINTIGLSKSNDLSDSHRFKGFPDSNFAQGRDPLRGSPKPIPTVTHRKPQHFVKGVPLDHKLPNNVVSSDGTSLENGRPNVISKNGVQYGSEEHHKTPNVRMSAKKKTPFWNEDRSSAEVRKKARQMTEAEWDQDQWKNMKKEQLRTDVDTKKKDLQMLREYKPFGRPGAGAPRREQESYRTKAVHNEQLNDGPEILKFLQFGKPGNGAPIRTDSGNVKTSIRSNIDIRFRDGVGMRRGVENNTRYTNAKEFGDKVNTELGDLQKNLEGNMALEKRTVKEMERQIEKAEERKTWDYNPYGKSGAGAPIKTDSGNLMTGRARTLAKDPLELKQIEEKPYMKKLAPGEGNTVVYNPWGKGQGAPERDALGNSKKLTWGDANTAPENFVPVSTGVAMETKPFGGGGHQIDEKGEKKTRFHQTLQNSSNPGEVIIEDGAKKDPSEPWGRPGGGAPLFLPNGSVNATNRGKAVMDMMGIDPPKREEVKAKQEYLKTLKTEIDYQKSQRQREAKEVMKPGGETVNWIRSKEVGYRSRDPTTGTVLPVHHKATSDITRHVMDIRRPTLDVQDYRTDLVHQAEQRIRQKDLEREVSRQEVSQHHQTFKQQWGRPGNGAPYDPAMKRHALDPDTLKQTRRVPEPAMPWVRTKALESRFRDPNYQPTVPRQQPMVLESTGVANGPYQLRAPWGAYSV
ncbi:uncharacterized protein LOC756624 isoform X3 [Strongylocentrotus purpuratus]|uniref:Uncharacterized protein n=1 Tax=Strongylocentrotus purpuratus TaxID=7668 RepID=A0A7M7N0R8_STRPU|nr:uncharacterized protein LOC756624 isoform X3 [Strongylocentrotus purpuratus]